MTGIRDQHKISPDLAALMRQRDKDVAAFEAKAAKAGGKYHKKIWVQIAVALAIALVSTALQLLLAPKPKKQKPRELDDFEEPTSEAGRPIPIVWGTVILLSPNCQWWGEKNQFVYDR